MAESEARKYLLVAFDKKHVDALLRHFSGVIHDFQKREWEYSIGRAGKFVEAVLKALFVRVGKTIPTGRGFKTDAIINGLSQLSDGACDDSIRLTIPRACRFIYDISSNRGGRHDSDGLDPNEMDATVIVSSCSWILAEMIRLSQKTSTDPQQAKKLVDSLMEKKYPLVEEIDGRTYIHIKNKTATDVALLTLSYRYPKRFSKHDLIETVKRNGFKDANARVAIQRISHLMDNDGNDHLLLLSPGLREAERIMNGAKWGSRENISS
jgi:hypothetical protein